VTSLYSINKQFGCCAKKSALALILLTMITEAIGAGHDKYCAAV
jgi:hypothetical protein